MCLVRGRSFSAVAGAMAPLLSSKAVRLKIGFLYLKDGNFLESSLKNRINTITIRSACERQMYSGNRLPRE